MCTSVVCVRLTHATCSAALSYKCHGRIPNIAFTTQQAALPTSSAGESRGDAASPALATRRAGSGHSFENTASRMLGLTLGSCPSPGALRAFRTTGPDGGVITTAGSLPDPTPATRRSPAAADVLVVMEALSDKDKEFLERMAQAMARCRTAVEQHVLPCRKPGAGQTSHHSRLVAACDLLQDVARAGNIYVQHVVGDFSRSRGGTFWHVLTCQALAMAAVEVIACLLVHAMPRHGVNLLQQLALSEADVLRSMHSMLEPARPERPAGFAIVSHTLRRAGLAIGTPAPLFRHIGKRMGRKIIRESWGIDTRPRANSGRSSQDSSVAK